MTTRLPHAENPFMLLTDRVNARFQDAVVCTYGKDGDRDYFNVGWREGTAHRVGVFCLNTTSGTGAGRAERLLVAIPIEQTDTVIPVSVLGKAGVNYFYLTLPPRIGGAVVRLDAETYDAQFTGDEALVPDLADKVETYSLLPRQEW